MFTLYLICVISFLGKCSVALEFQDIFKWKQMEYQSLSGTDMSSGYQSDFWFPDTNTQQAETLIPYNNVPVGICRYNDILFITVPRRNPGIPSTLNFINIGLAGKQQSPKLHSYPEEAMGNSLSTLQSKKNWLVSVYRPRVDSCKRLWFVDTGTLEYPNNRIVVQRPAIWAIDLPTNQAVTRFEIPTNVVQEGRGLISLAVDIKDSCDDAYVYIPDLLNAQLHVYSLKQNRAWTFRHNYLRPDPLSGDFSIAGQNYQWSDGIFSITLADTNSDGFRTAYFHPLASTAEFTVSTSVLRNETKSKRSYHGTDFKYLGSRGANRQASMHAYEPKTKAIFYAEIAQSAIGCWNTKKGFSNAKQELIHQDTTSMIYPSDLMVDEDGIVWALTNSIPVHIYSKLNVKEYNFRVWKQTSANAVSGTACA